MTDNIDFSRYSTILFLDSMVVLEGKPLEAQPWQDIDNVGPILLLVVPQVLKEVDKRKRDGRLGKYARAFNRLIMPAAETSKAIPICDGDVRVDIALAVPGPINWDVLDDLDPEEGDARVVAQVIQAQNVPSDNKLFFSQDVNPIAMASRHKVKTSKMPEHWLRQIEPSPQDKQVQKLKARVKELEATEPIFEIRGDFDTDRPFKHFRIEKPSQDQANKIIQHVFTNHPRENQSRFGLGVALTHHSYDHEYDEKYARYSKHVLPNFVNSAHLALQEMHSQVRFRLTISNTGKVPANDLILRIEARKGAFFEKWQLTPGYPSPPRPQPFRMPYLGNTLSDIMPVNVGKHQMVYVTKPDTGSIVEVNCADFRHGNEWDCELIACIAEDNKSNFEIEVSITASNMKGDVGETFSLTHTIETAPFENFYDLREMKSLIPDRLRSDFEELEYDDFRRKFELQSFEDSF